MMTNCRGATAQETELLTWSVGAGLNICVPSKHSAFGTQASPSRVFTHVSFSQPQSLNLEESISGTRQVQALQRSTRHTLQPSISLQTHFLFM